MKCDLVIISFNTRKLVAECIDSAISTSADYIDKIIVVDNNSSDDTVEFLCKNYPRAEVICNSDNLGYSKAVNIGVSRCNSEYVLISNSDIVFLDSSIKNVIEFMCSKSDVAVVAPRQLFADLKYQYSYGYLPTASSGIKELLFINTIGSAFGKFFFNKFGIDRATREVQYADGGMIAVRKSVFDFIGGFDEDYPFYSEDMDFSYRVKKANSKVIFYPKSRVVHYRGGSSKSKEFNPQSLRKMQMSKIIFATKHFSPKNFKIYANTQIAKSIFIAGIAKLLSPLHPAFARQLEYHTANASIWREIKENI